MNNITNIAGLDLEAIKREAQAEVNKEKTEKAKKALLAKYRELASAEQIVKNVKAQIADLEASITDGSFVS